MGGWIPLFQASDAQRQVAPHTSGRGSPAQPGALALPRGVWDGAGSSERSGWVDVGRSCGEHSPAAGQDSPSAASERTSDGSAGETLLWAKRHLALVNTLL